MESTYASDPSTSPGRALDPGALSPKTRADLGWDSLTEQLGTRCHTARGAELARGLTPLPTIAAARTRQTEITEARGLQDSGEAMPMGGISDVAAALLRCEKGGVLAPAELVDVANTLLSGTRLRRHLLARGQRVPALAEHAAQLSELPEVAGPIRDAFDDHGTLRDSASPALAGLRQRVNQLLAELGKRTESLLLETHIAPHLQDRFVTQREDRYVLPVRADSRTRIRGIVHGTSASGATIFVEPEEIIELNNRLKLAQLEVTEEERRILTDLSQRVEQAAPRIAQNLDGLAYLDLVDAAGKLASDLRASPTTLVDPLAPAAPGAPPPAIDLRHGRHPLMLLAGTQVVPNDVVVPLGGTLIVSGPNAGGKTVALKLTGLCALMARAGLHLPVQEGSTMPWFSQVLTDVGDDQSLEQNLSTFSAHVMHLRRFLDQARLGTLILLDEVAVGTDPEQGAALAQALLESLAAARATVMLTTHYDRLKALGASGAYFGNASVGFDLAKLQPTYRLHLGIPGASSALAVAERLGLPRPVVERTRGLLERAQTGVDVLLQALADERERTRKLHEEAQQQLEEARREMQHAAEIRDQAQKQLMKARRSAHDDAVTALQAARRDLNDARLALRALHQRAETDTAGAQSEYQSERRRVEKLAQDIAAAAPPPQKAAPAGRAPAASDVPVGTKVYVSRLGGFGTVVSDPSRDKVVVQVGPLRLTVEISELLLPDDTGRVHLPPSHPRSQTTPVPQMPVPSATPPRTPAATIDLRGERLPVAIARTEKFIDDALRDTRAAVFVLHGHGTGILRQAVRSHFAAFPGVRRVRAADPQDGGDGVTVLELDT